MSKSSHQVRAYKIKHNREVSKSDWRMIQSIMAYKAKVVYLDPKNTSKRCSRCGMVNAPKGALYECNCGLRIDRHLNAAINLYLKMEGLSPTPKLFKELMKGWRGFTLTGEEADEGHNELERAPRLVNPKSYVRLRSSEPTSGLFIVSHVPKRVSPFKAFSTSLCMKGCRYSVELREFKPVYGDP